MPYKLFYLFYFIFFQANNLNIKKKIIKNLLNKLRKNKNKNNKILINLKKN